MKTASEKRVPLFALFRVFFWIGLYSFGGGLTAWMHREVVETRRWMTQDQFLSGLAMAQVLPGVNSTNLAIFIGQGLRGPVGALTAVVGTLAAPFAFILVAAIGYELLLSIPAVSIALVGMAAAAVGMLVRMGMSAAGSGLYSVPAALVMIATFVAVGVLRWPIIPVLAVMVPLSVAAAWPRAKPDA